MQSPSITRRSFVATGALAAVAGCQTVPPRSIPLPVGPPPAALTGQATPIVQSPKRIWDLLPADARAFLEQRGIPLDMLAGYQIDEQSWVVDGNTAQVMVRQEWTGECYIQCTDDRIWVDALPADDLTRAGQCLAGQPAHLDTVAELCQWLGQSPNNLGLVGVRPSPENQAVESLPLSALAGIASNPSNWSGVAVTATATRSGSPVVQLQIRGFGPQVPVQVQISQAGEVTEIARINNLPPLDFLAAQVTGQP